MTRPEDDEFAEFDLTEDQFDDIMQRGEPARLVDRPRRRTGWTLYFNLAPSEAVAAAQQLTEPQSRAFGERVS